MHIRETLKEHITTFMKVKCNLFLNNEASLIQFPVFEQPEVSIILVVYNRAEYTYQCLETIRAHADVPYEIVIVDNASSDETGALLRKIKGTVIVSNSENKGYIKGCNQGAAAARGKWLLFLNNDTQITPSLLSTLVQTANNTKNCGAVGARLIFPDGKLQEAGSIIWNDGSCVGYGRGDDPFKPEYSYVREVDYCSGACFLIRKELFQQVGMFAEDYHPGYYEETDLCMKLRELGYKVMYQPAAVVIHYEFGSGSANESIARQNKNKETFVKRWEAQLAEYYPPRPKHLLHARQRRRPESSRILVIDDRIPIPALGCGYPRSYKILEGLAKADYDVTLFPLQVPQKVEPFTHLLQQMKVEVIYSKENPRLNLRQFLTERHDYYDLVMISRLHNMQEAVATAKELLLGKKIVYDTEALFSLREIRKQEILGIQLPEQIKSDWILQEINAMNLASTVVTVSEREKRIIESYGVKQVNVLSHVVEKQATPNEFDKRHDILFVGSFTPGSPNEDAVLHFTREVFPLVHKELGAKLWIVGTNFLKSVKDLASDHIMVTGTVPDLWNYYNSCRVFVVPTRYAAGISLKLLECLSHGVPAVVTPLIAQQMDLTEKVVLIGDGPKEFAEKIIRCYTDKRMWQRLRQNGLQHVEKHYHADQFQKQLLRLVAQ